jgi:hypothetical protein
MFKFIYMFRLKMFNLKTVRTLTFFQFENCSYWRKIRIRKNLQILETNNMKKTQKKPPRTGPKKSKYKQIGTFPNTQKNHAAC